VVEITPMGIGVMKGTRELPAGLEDMGHVTVVEPTRSKGKAKETVLAVLDGEAQERFERLRTYRREQADAMEIPAYCIFHDSTLRLIALANPGTLKQLGVVKGVGDNKLQKYGDGVLEALGRK
jgi:ATP-dependent DNA helicase RecQ